MITIARNSKIDTKLPCIVLGSSMVSLLPTNEYKSAHIFYLEQRQKRASSKRARKQSRGEPEKTNADSKSVDKRSKCRVFSAFSRLPKVLVSEIQSISNDIDVIKQMQKPRSCSKFSARNIVTPLYPISKSKRKIPPVKGRNFAGTARGYTRGESAESFDIDVFYDYVETHPDQTVITFKD